MKTVRAIVLTAPLLLAILLPSTPAAAQDATDSQIRELLEVMNSGEMGIQIMEAMIAQFDAIYPDVPQEYWDEFMARIDAGDLDDMVAPIYQRHFSQEEVLAMTEFYQTPLGQSVLEKLPVVMQESMAAGQAWGEAIVTDLIADLAEKGYEVPGADEL